MGQDLKILLLGDYSNCQRTLATGLRRLGCNVTLVSDGSTWQNCDRDIDISRRPGKLGGLELFIKMSTSLRSKLKGYDIVSINDPNFITLKPSRLKIIFDRLRRDNRSVFLNAMSTDVPFLDMLEAADSPLRYSEWFVNGQPGRHYLAHHDQWNAWHSPALIDYHRHVYDHIDGATSVLYEYHCAIERVLPPDKIAYTGIPIDLDLYTPVTYTDPIEPVRIFLGRDRNRMLVKGSDLLEKAARIVIDRHPDKAELILVENRPFKEFTAMLRTAHIVLDQIYSYTPATTALMAMAYGLNVVSGGEPEYYDFIGESTNRPIINAPIHLDALVETLDNVVSHPEQLAERGRLSREFVETHNNCLTVAKRYLDFWTKRLQSC